MLQSAELEEMTTPHANPSFWPLNAIGLLSDGSRWLLQVSTRSITLMPLASTFPCGRGRLLFKHTKKRKRFVTNSSSLLSAAEPGSCGAQLNRNPERGTRPGFDARTHCVPS